jgi:uncharacterized RDD family membrane protein YckC
MYNIEQQKLAIPVGFWSRLVAAIIDGILITVLVYIIIWPVFRTGVSILADDFEKLNMFVDALYTIAFWMLKQATLGKMLIGAKVIKATGGKPSIWRFIVRYIAYIFSALPLGLGFIWIAFDSQKHGWHDIIAGTLVVKS